MSPYYSLRQKIDSCGYSRQGKTNFCHTQIWIVHLGQGNESHRFASTARTSQGLPLKNSIVLLKNNFFHEKKKSLKKSFQFVCTPYKQQ